MLSSQQRRNKCQRSTVQDQQQMLALQCTRCAAGLENPFGLSSQLCARQSATMGQSDKSEACNQCTTLSRTQQSRGLKIWLCATSARPPGQLYILKTFEVLEKACRKHDGKKRSQPRATLPALHIHPILCLCASTTCALKGTLPSSQSLASSSCS